MQTTPFHAYYKAKNYGLKINYFVTEFTYNALGKEKAKITSSDESVSSNTIRSYYDVNGNLVKKTETTDVLELNRYDRQNRLVSSTKSKLNAQDGITKEFYYDAAGNKRFETDGRGHVTENTYYANGKVHTSAIQGTSHITTYSYDKNGNLLTEADFRSNVKINRYDPLNRLIEVIDANNVSIEKLYYNDNHMQIISVDALDKKTVFDYDKNNQLLSTTDPLGHIVGQTYDSMGAVSERFDGKNNKTINEYDELGRLKTVKQYVNGILETTSFTYDTEGNMLTQSNARGQTTTFRYNVLIRLRQK